MSGDSDLDLLEYNLTKLKKIKLGDRALSLASRRLARRLQDEARAERLLELIERSYQAQLPRMGTRMRWLEHKLEQTLSILSMIQSDYSKLDSVMGEFELIKQELANHSARLNQLESEHVPIQEYQEKYQQLISMFQDLHSKLEKLDRIWNSRAEKYLQLMEFLRQAASDYIKSSQEKLKRDLIKQISEIKHKSESELDEMKKKLLNLELKSESNLSQFKAGLEILRRAAWECIQDRFSKMMREHSRLSSDLDSASFKLDMISSQLVDLDSRLADQSKEWESQLKSLNQLRSDLSHISKSISDLDRRLGEMDRFREELQRFKQFMDETQIKSAQLSSKLSQLESKLSGTDSQLQRLIQGMNSVSEIQSRMLSQIGDALEKLFFQIQAQNELIDAIIRREGIGEKSRERSNSSSSED